MILPVIVAQAGADAPSLGQLIAHVQFDGPGLEPLFLGPLIALGREIQAVRHPHLDRAAELFGGLQRRLSRRRITGVEVLLIESESTVATLEEVVERDAHVGAVRSRHSSRIGERKAITLEAESAVAGAHCAGDKTLAPAGLHFEP